VFAVRPWLLIGLALVALSPASRAQYAVSALDQTRLVQKPPETPAPPVDANGNATPVTEEVTADNSFGAQVMLKNQEPVRTFVLSGDASIYYTSNVALTRRDTKDDVFAVVHAVGSWSRPLNPEVGLLIDVQAATFRYDRTSQLDFDNLGAGLGFSWAPPRWSGVSMYGRYDFTELLDRHGEEILRDHQFSAGVQKGFALGRAHAFTLGALASLGISTPSEAQRNQVGLLAGYHLLLTRSLETDLLYRIAYQSYSDSSRGDLNQVFSWNLRYRLTEWAEASAFFSFGSNRSNVGAFDYDVFSTGGGLGLTTRF
jgi:hypothetical protein